MAPLIHVVLCRFKEGTSQEAIAQCAKDMYGLKDKCLHPQTNKPYINVSRGGVDNSIEGLQDGMTHAFVVEFESPEDRDHYVNEAPAHAEFLKTYGPILGKIQVVDFVPGVLN